MFIILLTATYVCQQQKGNTWLHFHGNSSYVNMQQYYSTHTLLILFTLLANVTSSFSYWLIKKHFLNLGEWSKTDSTWSLSPCYTIPVLPIHNCFYNTQQHFRATNPSDSASTYLDLWIQCICLKILQEIRDHVACHPNKMWFVFL